MSAISIKNGCYLYRHIRLDKQQPFYIGIGNKQERDIKYSTYIRAYSKERNPIWKRITAKTAYEVEILLEDLTWEEACIKETEFIKLYGRIDQRTGILANLTDGGDGIPNLSLEAREKIRISKLGKSRSEETKKKMSIGLKGKKCWQKGLNVSQNTKNKLKDIALSNNFIHPLSKSVIDIESGKVYKSIGQAARSINIMSSSLSRMLSGETVNKTNFKYYEIH